MEKSDSIFDQNALFQHRKRAKKEFKLHDFMIQEVAGRLSERLEETNRNFDTAIGICWQNRILREICHRANNIDKLIVYNNCKTKNSDKNQIIAEPELFPIAPKSIDLFVSLLEWHWINDLPGVLSQSLSALKSDGLILGAMFGGNTLTELRTVLIEAEMITKGGVTPRIPPFVDVETLGNLLLRIGFTLPVIDIDTINVTYPNAFKLMHEIRGMGETNCLTKRSKKFTRRDILYRAAELYNDKYGTSDGRINATFQVIFFTAWAPHHSQPKPKKRGSGKYSLESAINNFEGIKNK